MKLVSLSFCVFISMYRRQITGSDFDIGPMWDIANLGANDKGQWWNNFPAVESFLWKGLCVILSIFSWLKKDKSYIDMNQPWIYMCSPSRSPLPPPSPSHPSGSSQYTSPEHLSHASNLGWWSVSPLLICMFQCYSLRSSN